MSPQNILECDYYSSKIWIKSVKNHKSKIVMFSPKLTLSNLCLWIILKCIEKAPSIPTTTVGIYVNHRRS